MSINKSGIIRFMKNFLQILLKPVLDLKEMFLFNTSFYVDVDKMLGQIGTQSALIAGFSFAMLIEELSSNLPINFTYFIYVLMSVMTVVMELFAMFGCGLLSLSERVQEKDFESEFHSTLLEIWGAYSIGIVTFTFSLVFITFNKLEGLTGLLLSFLVLFLVIASLIYGRDVMRKMNKYQQSK
jgi:hypothetical protein